LDKLDKLRKAFQSKSLDERKSFIKSLSKKELKALYNFPDLFLFDKQIITGNQRYTILRCGRRFGKSIAGSAFIVNKIINGAKCLGLCGAIHEDVEKIMWPAIKSWFPYPLKYNSQNHTISGFNNGAIIHCFTSDKENRGYSLEYLWCDEIGSWSDCIPEKVKERFDILEMAVSAGKNPQIIITSTPKPFPLFSEWELKVQNNDPNYKIMTGTMFDNPFLSDEYKQSQLEKFSKTRFGRQEIYGELLNDIEGAAWTNDMIAKCRMSFDEFKNKLKETNSTKSETGNNRIFNKFQINRVVVGVDPSVSDKPDGDECGIIIAGLGNDNNVYIFNDYSGQFTTDQWGKQAIKALNDYDAGLIVIEKNNGGELVKKNILSIDNTAPIKTIQSTKGKIDRALPVAAFYERNRVFHVQPKRTTDQIKCNYNAFEKLENQMSRFTGNPKQKSPDRLDALVFAVTELLLSNTYCNRDFTGLGTY
jgi:phage terminase large subunit-like protein